MQQQEHVNAEGVDEPGLNRLRALDLRALSFVSEEGCRGGFPELRNSPLTRAGGCGVRNGDVDITYFQTLQPFAHKYECHAGTL